MSDNATLLGDEIKNFQSAWRSLPSETRAKLFNFLRQKQSNKISATPDAEVLQLKYTVKAISIIETQLNQLCDTGKLA